MLFNAGILEREFFDNIYKCPKCNEIHIHYQKVCEYCGENDIKSEMVIEHLACGYIGVADNVIHKKDKDFCPECEGELKEGGIDFHVSSGVYCRACGQISSHPKPTATSIKIARSKIISIKKSLVTR